MRISKSANTPAGAFGDTAVKTALRSGAHHRRNFRGRSGFADGDAVTDRLLQIPGLDPKYRRARRMYITAPHESADVL